AAFAPLVQRSAWPVQPDGRFAGAELDRVDVRGCLRSPTGIPFPVREQAPQLDLRQFADDATMKGEPVRRQGVADDGDDRALTHATMVRANARCRNAKSVLTT